MHSVYLSPDIQQKKISKINMIISKYDGLIVEDQSQANLIIKNKTSPFDSHPTAQIISTQCLFMMDNELINPLTYNYSFKCLNNIFLKNKSFSFHNCSLIHIQQCSIYIKMMDGELNDESPNYYLVENTINPPYTNCVLIDWIYALQNSSVYINPSNYASQKTISLHNSNGQRTYQTLSLTPLKPKFIYTSDFILHAKSIQKQRRYNYENLKKELERTYPNLKFESFETFVDELKLGFSLLKIHNCFVNTQSPCCNYQKHTMQLQKR